MKGWFQLQPQSMLSMLETFNSLRSIFESKMNPLYISYGNLTIFTARNNWTFPHIKSAMFCDSVIHMKGLKSYIL